MAITLIALLLAAPAPAVPLLDLEADDALGAVHPEGAPPGTPVAGLTVAEEFATSGRRALRWESPAWREGLARWPAFEIDPAIRDWRGFDRLAFDVVNESGAVQRLNLFITDARVATRGGLHHELLLGPWSLTRVEVPLVGLAAKQVDAAAIARLHFYTADVPAPMVLHLDSLALLRPGESPEPLPTACLKRIGGLRGEFLAGLRADLATLPDEPWVADLRADIARRLAEYEALAERGDPLVIERQAELSLVPASIARIRTLAGFRTAFAALRRRVGATRDDVAVGVAGSMEKVLPRAGALPARAVERVTLELARGEKESLQVVVVPFAGDLAGVRVEPGELRSETGGRWPAAWIDVAPVGYVETRAVPPYGSDHVGWWPDPILGFLGEVPVQRFDAQAIWVRLRCPRNQPAGDYSGQLRVVADGRTLCRLGLDVRVHDFALPTASPLPLAITFGPHDFPQPETAAEQEPWRSEPDYPINAWKRHKDAWADMLADYYISYDSLYHRGGLDFELLARLHREGRLGRFNLGYYGPCGGSPEEQAAWRADTLPRLREGYEQAKALGLLDLAYIYGADEAVADLFGAVERAAAILKAEFPGVMVMTTTYDHSFGLETEVQSVDAWCPLTPRWDTARAAASRAAGREVWWYICCGPHHPSANMFIEYPAIEGRLLMGALTQKYRPDGFLYYQISIWNSRRPITSGPFTDWDPRSWTTYHGDGSWTCVGPDGTPLPTVRLENFRDGLEDFAWCRVLEATARAVEADPAARAAKAEWLAAARAALAVPADLAASGTEYSRDPAVLLAWRRGIGELIATAGIRPVEPWSED